MDSSRGGRDDSSSGFHWKNSGTALKNEYWKGGTYGRSRDDCKDKEDDSSSAFIRLGYWGLNCV